MRFAFEIITLYIHMYIRDAFRMFDRNMDGYIDMSELRKMFAMVGVGDGGVFSRDEMDEFMEEADRVSPSIKCFFVFVN